MYYWVICHDVEDNVFHECIIYVVINTWWGLAGYGLLGYILASRCKFINLVNSKLSYLDLFYFYWHLILLFGILSSKFLVQQWTYLKTMVIPSWSGICDDLFHSFSKWSWGHPWRLSIMKHARNHEKCWWNFLLRS